MNVISELSYEALLARHPSLRRVYDETFFRSLCPEETRNDKFLFNQMLADVDEASKVVSEIEELMALAETYGILNEDLRSRMRSRNTRQYLPVLSELSVARFLSARGFELTFHPTNETGRVGEFEAIREIAIFIEVKSLFRNESESREQRISEKVRAVVGRIAEPFMLWVVLKRVPNDFSERRLESYLRRELARIRSLPKVEGDAIIEILRYEDDSGIEVTFDVQPCDSDHCIWSASHGMREVDNIDRLRRTIGSARHQLPRDKPALVLLDPFTEFPVDEFDLMGSLYGSLTTTVNVRTLSRHTFRDNEGVFSRTGRIGAVGQVRRRSPALVSGLEVYHNGRARSPIAREFLDASDVRQLIAQVDGELVWHDPTP